MPRSRRVSSPRALLGFLLLVALSGSAGLSCSDGVEDGAERACRVVVEDCGVGPSLSSCLDWIGELTESCIECIAEGAPAGDGGQGAAAKCGYASCQRLPNCRVPDPLLPESARDSAAAL